jgi:Txe/YoeB family toxin of Txe-Axe toxin-antitoxin module
MTLKMLPEVLDAYRKIKETEPGKAERIKLLLSDALLHPESGKGNPLRLEGEFRDLWQRTLSSGEKITYRVTRDTILVIAVLTDGLSSPAKIQEYTDEEFRSVLAQMEANRGHAHDPKVGIFWYNRANNSLYGVVSHRVSDYTRANASDGRITCSELHEDVWKKEFHKQRYQYGGQGPFVGAYQDKPRGRIFYHMDTDTYEVAVGKWFEDYPQAYDEILKEFDLPPEKTLAKYAIHWDIGQSWR